ncbi:MAG TPA: saccharopine dehydrogenase NADP-binding domain-containing protein [Nitrospira sp.]|nr:saccharopine dehydrogenase NADP-binding domain-containing protein [Nitrospira sp.]
MRIFVLGIGAAGSLLVKLLTRQGHQVSCGDRDLERAHHFLGNKSAVPVQRVNARDMWGILKAARRTQLLVNACPPVLNKTVMRAALRLRAHYLDTASHYTGHPFRAEQTGFAHKFEDKRRTAVITAGVAPGLSNLLIAAGADLLDSVTSCRVRLYEATDADGPFSQWSAEASFDEAIARPRIYVNGRFEFGRRFGERELFQFPSPIGPVSVVLAAQDEVITAPYSIPMGSMDAKFGGSDIDRLRRWYRQGKLRKSSRPTPSRFARTPTPRTVRRLFRQGMLHNAHFAAAVIVEGIKQERPTTIRWDVMVPSLFQLRRQGLLCSPIAWATAQMAALFIKHFPRESFGVHPPESLPMEIRRSILRDARGRGFRVMKRMRSRAPLDL